MLQACARCQGWRFHLVQHEGLSSEGDADAGHPSWHQRRGISRRGLEDLAIVRRLYPVLSIHLLQPPARRMAGPTSSSQPPGTASKGTDAGLTRALLPCSWSMTMLSIAFGTKQHWKLYMSLCGAGHMGRVACQAVQCHNRTLDMADPMSAAGLTPACMLLALQALPGSCQWQLQTCLRDTKHGRQA